MRIRNLHGVARCKDGCWICPEQDTKRF